MGFSVILSDMYVIHFGHTHPIALFAFSLSIGMGVCLSEGLVLLTINSFVWEVYGKLLVLRFLTASHAANSQ